MDVKTYKFIKTTSLVVFILAVFTFPILIFIILYGLVGFYSAPTTLMAVGYLGTVFSSLVSIFKPKYFLLIVLSLLVGVVGYVLDVNDAKQKNADLCIELRAEPTCVETACGFSCGDFKGVGFTTSYKVCTDKPSVLCQEQIIQDSQIDDSRRRALSEFEEVVGQIINHPNPMTLDFEDTRVAIYNCLEEIGSNSEFDAIARLQSMDLTPEQLEKYYTYLGAHGKNVNRQAPRPVAALPAGDTSLSCGDLN